MRVFPVYLFIYLFIIYEYLYRIKVSFIFTNICTIETAILICPVLKRKEKEAYQTIKQKGYKKVKAVKSCLERKSKNQNGS